MLSLRGGKTGSGWSSLRHLVSAEPSLATATRSAHAVHAQSKYPVVYVYDMTLTDRLRRPIVVRLLICQ